ncbi:MAG: UbiD family decarboxylase [Magnetococcales bacterium]|nr:UbiD family decarboxylase [Magnetococcales bacterium]
MLTRSFRDLRAFMRLLTERGILVTINQPVDPHLEMTAICQRLLQNDGPAVLFTRPIGHTMPVLANLFGTEERVGLAIGRQIEELEELGELLAALRHPTPPQGVHDLRTWLTRLARVRHMPTRTVRQPACRQQVWEGEAVDLRRLPIQTCWPGDAAPLITWGAVVTRGATGGPLNLGIYRMQLLGRNRLIMRWLAHRGGAQHLKEFNGRPMPVAVVIGCDPGTLLAAVTPVPESLSEYAFAGLLREQRVELAPELPPYPPVPAHAEIVLEGVVDPKDLAPEGPFGDHTGYYNEVDTFPVLTVQRLSMRHDAIYLSTFTGRPPDEPAILALALNRVFTPLLKKQFPEIHEFHLSMEACSYRVAVIALHKNYPGHAFRVMAGVWGFLRQFLYVKYIFVVDEGVDVTNWPAIWQAVEQHVHAGRDFNLLRSTPIDYLDFSSPVSGLGGKLGVDATRKWEAEQLAVAPMEPRNTAFAEPMAGFPGVLEERRLFDQGWIRMIRVDSRIRPGVGAWILNHLQTWGRTSHEPVWVVDWDTQLNSMADLAWALATRTDPGRDLWVDRTTGRWMLNATMRTHTETGREWGTPLVMDPQIEAKVTAKWRDYGLP